MIYHMNLIRSPRLTNLSEEEEEDQFQSSNNCMYCNKVFKDDKVRDHCHFTGKYRGSFLSYM